MLPAFLILVALAAVFWTAAALSPSARAFGNFIFDRQTDPAIFSQAAAPALPCPSFAAQASTRDPAFWPAVTIISPGRNEGHLLEQTLGSVCGMDYPDFRVIFVDDQSTDGTLAVCDRLRQRFPHLTVLHNTVPPPAGWVGKVWAIHQAREFVTTPYVLFVDSDLRFDPACLKQMIRLALIRKVDLLSMLPYVDRGPVGEQLLMMAAALMLGLAYPLRKSNDPKFPDAITAGGFLLFKRQAYETIGGHEAVRGQVIEDIALGRRTKSSGFSIFTVATQTLMGGRMYEGTKDCWRGFKKNAFAGTNYSIFTLLFSLAFILFCCILPGVYPLVAIILAWHVPGWIAYTALGASLWTTAIILSALHRGRGFMNFAAGLELLWPIAAFMFACVLVASAYDHFRGGNVWAGRRYVPENIARLNNVRAAKK